MIKTVEEGLEIFKKELKVIIRELKKIDDHEKEYEKRPEAAKFPRTTIMEEVQMLKSQKTGMIKVLDLSDEKLEKIEKEIKEEINKEV